MINFVSMVLNNQLCLGIMCFGLIGVPIIGIWAIHKYEWQHWEPFDRKHK